MRRTRIDEEPIESARLRNELPLIVPLQSGKDEEVLILAAPGAGASVTSFLSLVTALGDDVAVLGLEPRGLHTVEPPYSTVEAAATAYIPDLLQRSSRKYRLIGHSFGGWVVLEIARRLIAKGGIDIGSVILLDTEPPTPEEDSLKTHSRADAIARLVLALKRKGYHDLTIDCVALSRASASEQTRITAEALRASRVLHHRTQDETVGQIISVFSANFSTAYRPASPLPLSVCLLYPAETFVNDEDYISLGESVRRWRPFVQSIETHTVPGNHMTMLDQPYVEAIAKQVRRLWLRACE